MATLRSRSWVGVSSCTLALAFVLTGCKGGGGETSAAKPLTTDEERALYVLGVEVGRSVAGQVKVLGLKPEEVAILQRGLAAASEGKPLEVDPATEPRERLNDYMNALRARAQSVAGAQAAQAKSAGEALAASAGKEAGAVVLPSGLIYRTLTPGNGPSPSKTDTVTVHYRGTLPDGTEFDSSIKRGQPAQFRLDGVIPCWTEGVGRMKVGEKAKLVCPSAIAYGDRGQPPTIPPGATLVFEVELIGIGAK